MTSKNRVMNTGKLFIISGPSGAGKSTLVQEVLQHIGPHRSISRAITYTTRHPRNDEQDGYDFHFLTETIFKERITDGFFLEWSNAHVAYYGTPRSILEGMAQGDSYILVIDRVGAEQIKTHVNEAILIWIDVPDMVILKKRLLGRGTENMAHIERRLKRAHEEIALEQEKQLFDYHLMNEDFTKTAKNLELIIKKEIDKNVTIEMPKAASTA